MAEQRAIRILHLYDQYLNIYADRGNIEVLRRRCLWRGLGCTVDGLGIDDTFDAGDYDLLYVGGGQDRDQQMIAERMAGAVGAAIRDSVEQQTPLLAVCGGYQLMGERYLDTTGVEQPGIGLYNLHTKAAASRLIGNIAIEATLPALHTHSGGTYTLVGFENHAGRTHLADDATPLGRVVSGYGNDGSGSFEGCLYERAVGTYLHGPLLPRNPELADWLIAAALEHRYRNDAPALVELDDTLAVEAKRVALGRAHAERR